MSLFNKLLLSAFFSITCVFYAAHAEQTDKGVSAEKLDWKKFSSEKNGFSVDLPTFPDHVEQKIAIPQTDLSINYDTYISEPSQSQVYVVSVWYYPDAIDMSKPEVNLKDGFEGMLTALPGSKVIKMEMGEFNKFKALDFVVKHEDIFFQGKLILVYNTLYQVFTVYKDNQEMKEGYSHFIDSFNLIDPEKNKVQTKEKPATSKKMNVMLEKF